MKKILIPILTLFCVLSLVGCERSMDDIIENEPSITGVVEEVYDNPILISIQTDTYPYGTYCDVSLDVKNKDGIVDFNIGDEVVVYYDRTIFLFSPRCRSPPALFIFSKETLSDKVKHMLKSEIEQM